MLFVFNVFFKRSKMDCNQIIHGIRRVLDNYAQKYAKSKKASLSSLSLYYYKGTDSSSKT